MMEKWYGKVWKTFPLLFFGCRYFMFVHGLILLMLLNHVVVGVESADYK